jgi:hypothetical protein
MLSFAGVVFSVLQPSPVASELIPNSSVFLLIPQNGIAHVEIHPYFYHGFS